MSYLLLTDTVRALHCGTTPLLSSTELDIAMPGSSVSKLHETYALLFQLRATLPADLTSSDDAIILLVTILSDYLSIQSSLRLLVSPSTHRGAAPVFDPKHSHHVNPFVPLSPTTELARIKDNLRAALSRWHDIFGDRCSEDVTALYFYCRLALECPHIWCLPELAGYPSNDTTRTDSPGKFNEALPVTDEALRMAWLVVESIDMKKATLRSRLSIWLPVVVFHAALVVWQKLESTDSRTYGSLRVLTVFEKELTKMPWPCTLQMVETLQMLIR